MTTHTLRRLLSLLCIPALLAVFVVLAASTTRPAEAAVASDFRAGNIIADAVFYDPTTMAPWDVQSFLNGKLTKCADGFTCLKDFRENTWTRPADAQCGQYNGVAGQSAADIIWNVAQACRVNPRVLLVLLQKETALVTKTAPTWDNAYRKATGYGCPDTPAGCDAAFYGFYNQVYKAAWQYRKYAIDWKTKAYQPGRWNEIPWDRDPNCGKASVYIENQATAGLYIYTPYVPNQAALNNLYGSGDNCSEYGNRNFWRLFTDWWGSTQFSVVAEIESLWQQMGRAEGALGAPVGARYGTWGNGWTQSFRNGRIHYSPTTGAHAVLAPISPSYDKLLGESGPLGYPVGAQYGTWGNGWTQGFQNGRIHYSPTTGAHAVLAPISSSYDNLLGESGPLGYPVTDRYGTANGGFTQGFQNGRIHYSPTTGAHAVIGATSTAYDRLLGEAGSLGYPVAARYATVDGGFTQAFQNGRIHWSPTTGAHPVVVPIAVTYDRLTGESGPLGYPLGARYGTANDGWTQAFENGRIHHSPTTGTHPVLKPLAGAYDALLGESGALGYPLGARYATWNNGWTQAFQNGRIHFSPVTGAHAVLAPISSAYDSLLGESGALGYPLGGRYSTPGGGWTQAFQNGRIHYSPVTGAHAVLSPISSAYDSLLGESGALGYPTHGQESAVRSGRTQAFQNGRIYWSTGTGAHAVLGSIATAYDAAAREGGRLGYPTGAAAVQLDGSTLQTFEHGSIRWASGEGATVVLD
ncbi:MAG: hypothetical protein JWR82_1332 [Blastococcus sp.]|nr:hypothetical protein [Blastococcus sp.]